ncbi:transcription elongation factor GreA [Candidatus Kuenenbacteria bacterium CG23_combo_of_CG06-09_8_20_14_all_36_9]|uniref:Transcription elongation factor GreA n=1 Tax=Candidatus Kuenenbacteria bacterium CG10_big_fil_rev_8_21_14_0_10_36_11 TaxID=1974618 RepID=A0A2M6WAK5_9BACT|nr:MAG: transcription elongation factor GreA [Candidatus Kuenenbacteria bacterium CG23_combo_of_CG06-09_8_20_14_all_36_9]PIT89705.1 MAG: transcription elongation factor GreA [Candidatus Kuenenbacteria bacterium CG10_big_fil_rev_8_21_14_0_10_36_11]
MSQEQTYITKEGLDKLKQELHELVQVKRKEVIAKIEQAKEFGDLSENAEYHAARDEQAFIEGRIAELNSILKNITIIEETKSCGLVLVGSKIRIIDEDNKMAKEYKIVGSEEADPTQGLISNESPIGRAFLGKKAGDIVEIQTPRGCLKYKITEIV